MFSKCIEAEPAIDDDIRITACLKSLIFNVKENDQIPCNVCTQIAANSVVVRQQQNKS